MKKPLFLLAALAAPAIVACNVSTHNARYLQTANAAETAKELMRLDAATIGAVRIKMKGATKVGGSEDNPFPWSMNLWDAASIGEIALEETGGAKAIALRNLDGKGAIQFYNWQNFDVPSGRKIVVRCEYSTRGNGALILGGESIEKHTLNLPTTQGTWKTVEHTWNQSSGGKLNLNFQNYAVGAENALFIKSVALLDAGAIPATNEEAQKDGVAAPNATSALPELKAESVAHPHLNAIVTQTQKLRPRAVILGEDPDALLAKFHPVSVEGRAAFSTVNVEGMPFKKALRIDTDKKPQEWMTHLQLFTREKIRAGDLLYVTAWARVVRRTDGKAHGDGRLYASEERGGNQKNSSALYAGDFGIPQKWTRIHFGLRAARDHDADDELKLMFTFGHTSQIVEFGGVAGLNFGPQITKEELPHAELNLNYAGREPNAPWRKAALARIEKHRKNNLRVIVKDASGKPVPNAQIKANMTRHAYWFGSSFPIGMLPAEYQQIKPWHYFDRTAGAPQSDKNRIQQEFLRLFNCSTNGLTWATWTGADPRISQSDLLGSLRWFQEKNIALFNAQAVYPGTEFTDPKVHHEIFLQNKKDDFAKAVKNYVTLSATKFSPPVRSLQLANEIEGRPAYTNLLGRESVVDWFKWAKEANPKMKTEINGAYRLGEGDVSTQNRGAAWPGKDTEGLQYYFDLVSWLIKQGAPIDYIGIQNHAGIGAAGPEAVLKTLDQFATFGKPLEITEFEVTLQNGNDPKQRQYQADYTRDFFIAVFSHPQTHMIMLQDFWQPAAWQYEAASAFFNKDWSMNPHGKMYEDLVLNKWWTRATGKSNVKGEYSLRGFKGDYEIEVTANGKTQKAIAKIGDKPGVMTVTLK